MIAGSTEDARVSAFRPGCVWETCRRDPLHADRPNGSHAKLCGRFREPKSLDDEAWQSRGGVGGGPKPGRDSFSVKLDGLLADVPQVISATSATPEGSMHRRGRCVSTARPAKLSARGVALPFGHAATCATVGSLQWSWNDRAPGSDRRFCRHILRDKESISL